jgi:transposase
MSPGMRKLADPKWRPLRPAFDEWVGVGHAVLRYVDQLEERIDRADYDLDWARFEHREELAKLQKQLAERDRKIAELEQKLALVREAAGLTSRNSSKPPSSDPPSAPTRQPEKPSGRRRGGQPGHPFHPRQLYPVQQCASVTDHKPEVCRGCGLHLDGEDPNPLRHQIVEMPPVVPVVDEHRLHSLRCAGCGLINRANLPDGVSGTGFGPGVEATAAMLVSASRLSHRLVVAVLRDLCGVRLGLGTVSKLLRRASASTAESVEEARAYVREHEGAKHVDETGWTHGNADGTNEDGTRAWIWVASTEAVTVFKGTLSRSREVAKELTGEAPRGTLVSDRYLVYSYATPEMRQVCWAHLARDFRNISERDGPSASLGWKLVRVAQTVFLLHKKWRRGKSSQEKYEYKMGRLRAHLEDLLRQGASMDTKPGEQSPTSKTKNTCKELQAIEPALWTFVRTPGVDPTNNKAERDLRHAVMIRKVSIGSQSEDGMAWMSRLLTVVMTTRAQGRNPHAFFVESCRAARVKRRPPSLLPPTRRGARTAGVRA